MIALFLAAPNLPRFIRVMVLGKAVEAKVFAPLLGNVKLDRLGLGLRTLLVVAMLYGAIHGGYKRWSDMYAGPPARVAGRWELVSMEVDQKEPTKDDPMNWSWLDFGNRNFMRLARGKPPHLVYSVTGNSAEKRLILAQFRDPTWSAAFTYDLPKPEKLELQSSMDGKAISATLKPAPETRYELMNRGFRWIQEMPYNRGRVGVEGSRPAEAPARPADPRSRSERLLALSNTHEPAEEPHLSWYGWRPLGRSRARSHRAERKNGRAGSWTYRARGHFIEDIHEYH